MNFIKMFFNFFSTITLGILIVCAVNMSLHPEYDVPNTVLWQVLLSGLVTSLITVVGMHIFFKLNSAIKLAAGCLIHYAVLCFVMVGLGVWFDWINLEPYWIIVMLISVAVVYGIAYLLNYASLKKEADAINSALEEHNKRT